MTVARTVQKTLRSTDLDIKKEFIAHPIWGSCRNGRFPSPRIWAQESPRATYKPESTASVCNLELPRAREYTSGRIYFSPNKKPHYTLPRVGPGRRRRINHHNNEVDRGHGGRETGRWRSHRLLIHFKLNPQTCSCLNRC